MINKKVGYDTCMQTYPIRTIMSDRNGNVEFGLDSPWLDSLTEEITALEKSVLKWEAARANARKQGKLFEQPYPVSDAGMCPEKGVVSSNGQTFYLQSLG
ncbi:MAG: hypothetical protein MAG795_00021 [Candidatus Woesearchaeota archaeon]|nr:hypothetical protein [Candidatus Woesearchaeota archaeon]